MSSMCYMTPWYLFRSNIYCNILKIVFLKMKDMLIREEIGYEDNSKKLKNKEIIKRENKYKREKTMSRSNKIITYCTVISNP